VTTVDTKKVTISALWWILPLLVLKLTLLPAIPWWVVLFPYTIMGACLIVYVVLFLIVLAHPGLKVKVQVKKQD
jgi:hypothetical protein